MFDKVLTDFVVTAVIAMLLIGIGFVVMQVRQYWPVFAGRAEAELGATQWSLLRSMARTVILAAEQVAARAGLDTGEKKKQFVVDQLFDLVTLYKLPVSRDQLDTLVEGILKEIKRESTAVVLEELKSEALSPG